MPLTSFVLVLGYFHNFERSHLVFYCVIFTVIAMTWVVLVARLRIISKLRSTKKKIIQTKSRDMQSILDNIPLGVVPLGIEDGKVSIVGEYSAHVYQIFEDHKVKQDMMGALAKKTTLSSEEVSNIKSFVFCSHKEELFAWQANDHLLPQQTDMDIDGKIKHLSFQWHPVVSKKSDSVDQTLLIIRDETDLLQAKNENEQKKKDIEYLMQLVNIDSSRLSDFFTTAENHLHHSKEKVLSYLQNGQREDVLEAFRDLHTLKGLARSLD